MYEVPLPNYSTESPIGAALAAVGHSVVSTMAQNRAENQDNIQRQQAYEVHEADRTEQYKREDEKERRALQNRKLELDEQKWKATQAARARAMQAWARLGKPMPAAENDDWDSVAAQAAMEGAQQGAIQKAVAAGVPVPQGGPIDTNQLGLATAAAQRAHQTKQDNQRYTETATQARAHEVERRKGVLADMLLKNVQRGVPEDKLPTWLPSVMTKRDRDLGISATEVMRSAGIKTNTGDNSPREAAKKVFDKLAANASQTVGGKKLPPTANGIIHEWEARERAALKFEKGDAFVNTIDPMIRELARSVYPSKAPQKKK